MIPRLRHKHDDSLELYTEIKYISSLDGRVFLAQKEVCDKVSHTVKKVGGCLH